MVKQTGGKQEKFSPLGNPVLKSSDPKTPKKTFQPIHLPKNQHLDRQSYMRATVIPRAPNKNWDAAAYCRRHFARQWPVDTDDLPADTPCDDA